MVDRVLTAEIVQGRAFVVTGPTSGIGLQAALEIAGHGTVILVGRDKTKLDEVRQRIERKQGHAVAVVCDMSDVRSVRRAAAEIAGLGLTIAGLVNNAGIYQMKPKKSAQGWDMSYATNHLGPFVLTEALAPHMPDRANVVFVVSAIEDPERKPVKAMGMKGGLYISAEASVRGEWGPSPSKRPGSDAYATTKQANLASVFEFARELPRLRMNAVEPGINPTTGLGREAPKPIRFLMKQFMTRVRPYKDFVSTPEQAGRVITKVLLNEADVSGVYFDEKGGRMQASERVRNPEFRARVMRETRALLAGLKG